MLNVYVCPKRQPRYQPSADQLNLWLREAVIGGLLTAPEHGADASPSPWPSSSVFSPGLGVIQLFNQDAREALLPAELTFESLEVCLPTYATLLPPELDERTQCCPQCGDDVSDDTLNMALNKLEFISLERSAVFCWSCQDEIPMRSIEFDPPSSFAAFWIRLDEVGSSRLNPVLLRDWGHKLGCALEVLAEQRESSLEEIVSARQESEAWIEFERDYAHSSAEPSGLPDDLGRHSYRHSRYQRRQAQASRKRQAADTHGSRSRRSFRRSSSKFRRSDFDD